MFPEGDLLPISALQHLVFCERQWALIHLEQQWEERVPDVPLVVLESPYRSIRRPLLEFIEEVENWREDNIVTVVMPEFVAKRWWHQVLHNQTSLFLKAALLFQPGIVVVSVRQHLRR